MFNVSALLLDDALKPATPLTNVAINETLWQTLDISQGSVVTNPNPNPNPSSGMVGSLARILLQIFSWFRQWNNFENRLIFDEAKVYKEIVSIFWGHPVHSGTLT